MNPVGQQGAARLNADDTGVGEIAPVFQQLVAEPLDYERKQIIVEQYFSGLHGEAKVRCFRCFTASIHAAGSLLWQIVPLAGTTRCFRAVPAYRAGTQ